MRYLVKFLLFARSLVPFSPELIANDIIIENPLKKIFTEIEKVKKKQETHTHTKSQRKATDLSKNK